MQLWSFIGIMIILLVVAFFLLFFLRGTMNSKDASTVDKIPQPQNKETNPDQ